MKYLYNSAMHCNRKPIAAHGVENGIFSNVLSYFSWLLVIGFVLTSCQKEANVAASQIEPVNSHNATVEGNVVNDYQGLSSQTLWELQQARAATAKYRNIENALKDGYADIAVDVEHMGHHFMKTSIIDATFDFTQPEILVYNRDADGKQQLVAVEYAIPLNLPRPEGFTGSQDNWKGDSGFPFWLLHAWVWAYNPDGVFNWTNSAVELH